MGKKLVITIVSLIFVFTTVGIGFAGQKGNARKGKYTYRKIYKACKQLGKIDSAKPVLSPDAKTQAQWERTFAKKDFDQFGCMEEWGKLSEKELSDIFTYLYDHAADSPSPAKCK